MGLLAGSLGEKAAVAGLSSVTPMQAQMMATAATVQIAASVYRDRFSKCLARR